MEEKMKTHSNMPLPIEQGLVIYLWSAITRNGFNKCNPRENYIFGGMNDENESFGSGISRIYESNSISREAQGPQSVILNEV